MPYTDEPDYERYSSNIDDCFIRAVQDRTITVVRHFLDNGVNVDIRFGYAIRWAAASGNAEMVKLLLSYGPKDTDEALRWAAANGHLEVVRVLLDSGADVHASGDISIVKAAEWGHLEVVQILSDRGADAHEAIQVAATHGHLEVVLFLLNRGVDHRKVPRDSLKDFGIETIPETKEELIDVINVILVHQE